jgi:hypothetical protein
VPKHAPSGAVRDADSTLTALAEACAAGIPEVALASATSVHRSAEGRDSCFVERESTRAAVCRGYRSVEPRIAWAEARTLRCLRQCRSPPPACCCQPGAPCREDTPCSFRPEGRPAAAATALPGQGRRSQHRHADWIGLVPAIRRANPPQLVAPEYDVPSPRARRGDPAGPSVCAGFPVLAPSLHRCLSTAAHPRARVVAFGPAANAMPSVANNGRPAPIDSRAFLHRRVRSVNHRCQCSTPYTSMGFVPLRGFTGPSAAAPVPEGTRLAIPPRLRREAVSESVRLVRWPLLTARKRAVVPGRPPWGL